ncbi:hypothetical protein EN933_05430 [Mesorhizobium sp. M7A.F.Ca.US.001.01.1.1]|nr:hypothetical protein EN933_05430 [Mesorhizobium sp. M7A.F.Ca.US.001.01.1.1]
MPRTRDETGSRCPFLNLNMKPRGLCLSSISSLYQERSMSDGKYAYVIAAERLGDSWFNSDETRFALIPDDDGRIDDEAARILQQMLLEQRDGRADPHPEELISELLVLHSQRIVLWPLGLIWGRSVLGSFDEQWFKFVLSEFDPDFVDLRTEIENGPKFAHYKPAQRKAYAFALWKVLAAVHFSSSGVSRLDDLQEAHFFSLGRMIRPDGVWAQWATNWVKQSLRFSVRHMGDIRSDIYFARGVDGTTSRARSARRVDLFAAAPQLKWLEVNFDRWVNERSLMNQKHHDNAKRLLAEALLARDPEEVDTPLKGFSHANTRKLLAHAKNWSTPGLRSAAIGRIHDFGRWMEEESRDDNGRPRVVCHLSQHDVDRFREKIRPDLNGSDSGEVAARPMPYRFHQQLKEIISEADFAWPKSLISGIDGRPLHWFTWVDPKTGATQPVFNEVHPRLLMLSLDIPVRSVQGRRLDSGEGDQRRWNPETEMWEVSNSRHAGYWVALGASNPQRGVFREILSHTSSRTTTITGLYINSNKTQDRKTLFDETSGYVIPWQLDEVLHSLAAMRAWQEKYNPVKRPLAYSDLPPGIFDDNPTETAKLLIPDRFYLFRSPQNAGPRANEAPPSYKAQLQFFYDSLEELERRMREEDPHDAITIITERGQAGAPKKAIFTLHGTRSSSITSLYAEGVPIAVLSKLVAGHATILMTLKYAKFEPAHVSEILTRARISAINNSRDEFKLFLRNATYEQAARMSARLKEDGLAQMKGAYADASGAWGSMDIGICPNGGTLCHIGGDPVIKKKDLQGERNQYRETSGRTRNCVRCRFLVSGLPYLIPLWGHANMISTRADQLQARILENEREKEKLKAERRDANARGDPTSPELRQRIHVLEAEWESDIQLRDQAFADFHATLALIEKVRAVRSEDEHTDSGIPMIVNDEGLPEVEGRDSTRFELCDAVVQMGRFFPSLRSADLERERDEFLNRVLYSGGYIPITLAPLTMEERRAAADAMAALLLTELGALETQTLIEGSKTLADLGIQDRLEEVIKKSIGRPLDQMTFSPSGGSSRIELAATQ